MTTLHMETDAIRAMANQLKLACEELRSQTQLLNSSAQSVDWLGPNREEFVAETQTIIRAIEAQAEAGMVLSGRVEREVAEWEQAAARLGGSSAFPGLPVSGGSSWNWPTLPSSPLIPIFSLVTVAPWLGELPHWLKGLFDKYFPTPAPVVFPEIVSPIPESPEPAPRTGSFADLINRRLDQAPASPSAQPQPSQTETQQPEPAQPSAPHQSTRSGYDTYYEISPQAQGSTFGNAACLPTSLSMLTAYYHSQNPNNKVVTPQELVDMLEPGDGTLNGKNPGIHLDKLNDDMNEIGYSEARNFQSDLAGLGTELKGGPVVVNVKVGLTSLPERAIIEGNSANHSILVKGISGQNVLVNDPWSGKEMEIPADQFERMWSNGGHWAQVVRP